MTVALPAITGNEFEDRDIWRGVDSLLDQYMSVDGSDRIIVVYTADARGPASWVTTALKIRGLSVQTLRMSMYDDPGIESRLRSVLPDPSSPDGHLVILTLEHTSMANSSILRSVLAPYSGPNLKVFRVINASAELFRYSLRIGPSQLTDANAGLLNAMIPAGELHIASTSGTDLSIALDSERYRWVSNRGVWREGGFTILPPGEVSTLPANINGVLVADGAFNVTGYTDLDARLAHHPVRVEIEQGRLMSYECDHPMIQRLFQRCSQHVNFERVGELGFGTNYGTPEFIPMNSHINERRAAVHVGFGQHAQRMDAAGYECEIHLDLITSDMTVTADGGSPIDSRELDKLTGEHPPLQMQLHDEDIDALDGDCCGMTWASPLGLNDSCAVPRDVVRQRALFR